MRTLFLLFLGLAIFGCNRKSADGVSATRLPPKRSAAKVLNEVDRSLFIPRIAEMKGDMQVESGSIGNLKLNTIIRTQADSAFWFMVRKFGFEGARALVTKDSIVALNRLQREVLRASSSDVDEYADLLPFEPSLANLLAAFGGEPIGDWSGADVDRLPGQYKMTLPKSEGATLELSAGKKVLPMRWSYVDGDKFGEVIFKDFREVEAGKVFPYFRSLTFSDTPGDTTRLALTLSSFTTHESLEFPLSVPKSYSPMEGI